MKLLFLGTGSAEGLPALFCCCDVCDEARRRGGRNLRTRTSVLIDDTIKIDLPPDTLFHVHRYGLDLARLEHLLFTHSHDDHFAVRELQYLSPTFAPCRRPAPLRVWGTRDLICRLLPEMEGFFEQAPIKLCPLVPFFPFDVGHLRVTPLRAQHKTDELCLNFLVQPGLSAPPDAPALLYATDTGWYDDETWRFLDGRALCAAVVECGKGATNGGYTGHLNVDDVRRFRRRLIEHGGLAPDAPFFVTHLSHTGLLLHDELCRLLAHENIAVAYDGLQIEV